LSRLLAAAVWLGTHAAAQAADTTETLTYVLTPQFERGRLRVELSWETGQRRRSTLRVASRWGRIDDVTQFLHGLVFSGGTARQDGPMWILTHTPGANVSCTYEVYAGRRAFDDWDYTHHPLTTPEFFHGMGNAFLLAPNPGDDAPEEYEVVLRWQLPAGFKAACSWGVGRSVGARLKAGDIRQSVYLAGRLATHTMPQEGRSVTVAMVDAFGFTPEQLAQMTTAIIKQQCTFMDERAFPDFVATAIPVGQPLKPGDSRLAGSGLYNSFALCLAPQSKLSDAVEHLFAHELFHYWNGRLLAAADPERLVCWFTEGLTDYYALRVLFESGRWDAATYARWINKHVREYHLNPAIHASNEDINRDYWNQRDTVGEVAYQRGLMLGLRWHKLARQNDVPDGLDRLFQTLVRRGRERGLKLTNAAIRDAGVELLGAWFGPEFDRYINQAATVELPADVLAPKLVGKSTDVYTFELGFDRASSLKDKKVRGLVRGSAAQAAGLRERDLLAGWSIPADPDQPVRLQVQRGGETQTIEYYPRGRKASVTQFAPAGD